MSVRSIMTMNPACCTANTPLSDVAQMMLDHDCGQIPVVSGNGSRKPLGVITDRDIATRAVANGCNPRDMIASDCMTTPCVTVVDSTSVKEVCDLMESSRIRRVPVIDSRGDICGIVSLADVARNATSAITGQVVKEVSTSL